MTAISSTKRIEANRRNAQKSSGPKTAEGKGRVRLNALKHGLTASIAVLPGEDADGLKSRVEAWKEDIGPRSAMEAYLVERAAQVSWQLDRADRTIAARLTDRMRHHASEREYREADEVADLARRLFWDPRGPTALYPSPPDLTVSPRVSWPGAVDHPLNPARIVNRLESTATGCRWLLDRWSELRKILGDGRKWQSPDRLRAVRLLGGQPLDALDDERVLSIYLACNAMDPDGPPAFGDLAVEMTSGENKRFRTRAEGRDMHRHTPADPAAGKAVLLAIVDDACSRLEALLGRHHERDSLLPTGRSDALAFDDSDAGERMRRYQLAHGRDLLRTINTIFKVRKETDSQDAVAAESEAESRPAVYEPPIVPGDETGAIPSDAHRLAVDAPEIPAEAGSAAPARPEPQLHAESPSDHPDRPGPAGQPADAPAPRESGVQAGSGLSQDRETNPLPAEDRPTPALDPCSEGRHVEPAIQTSETNPFSAEDRPTPALDPCSEGLHVEPAIDFGPPLPLAVPSRNRVRAKASRPPASNSIPPAMIRLLNELVMREAVTAGPSRRPGRGRFAATDSP
jgi:hypothetical protein